MIKPSLLNLSVRTEPNQNKTLWQKVPKFENWETPKTKYLVSHKFGWTKKADFKCIFHGYTTYFQRKEMSSLASLTSTFNQGFWVVLGCTSTIDWCLCYLHWSSVCTTTTYESLRTSCAKEICSQWVVLDSACTMILNICILVDVFCSETQEVWRFRTTVMTLKVQ